MSIEWLYKLVTCQTIIHFYSILKFPKCCGLHILLIVGGWADVIINFVFTDVEPQIVCELQVVHSELLTARVECGGHKQYSKFRCASELLARKKTIMSRDEDHMQTYRQKIRRGYDDIRTIYTGKRVSYISSENIPTFSRKLSATNPLFNENKDHAMYTND